MIKITKKFKKAIAYDFEALIEQPNYFPIPGSDVLLDRALNAGYSNILYSNIPQEKLMDILRNIGLDSLIQHHFEKTANPDSIDFVRLVRRANTKRLDLTHYVTSDPEEAILAANVMNVSLLGCNRRMRVFQNLYELKFKP